MENDPPVSGPLVGDPLELGAESIQAARTDTDSHEGKPKKKKGLAAAGATVAVVLFKLKGLILLGLTKLKFLLILLKFGKFGLTTVSMAVTVWIYAIRFGLWFAVGFVALIFVHEMGHYYTAKVEGLPVSGPVFIPFVGALIRMKQPPQSALVEAKVGYGGPLWGSIGSLALLAVYWMTGSKLAAALAYTGFLINLFNLIPVHPLDGGRVVTAISPMIWFAGIPILGYMIWHSPNPILIIIAVMGGVQAYKLWKNKNDPYYDLPGETKSFFALLYFGLVGMLGFGIWYTLGVLGSHIRHF